ncbi:MAG: SO_0444 family Cu/Zn efflux transporter [Desulfuromonadales bacterium]|nr:SO_0444 family Cu/Zn efflux transporter [Desulfuromonadales bacterium]
MLNALTGIMVECWNIFNEAAPYVLFGFFAAGVLKALIPEKMIVRHLGGSGFSSVFKASLFGIPLPLCSCGVIPVAIGLRKQGASKGATASFLVSVPETGVDSIAITWALLDPFMTVIRPLAAFLTAMVTGTLINFLPESPPLRPTEIQADCGCSDTLDMDTQTAPVKPVFQRLKDGLVYAFTDLLKDIGGWLMLGILIAGIISYFVPIDFVERYLGGEYSSLLIMLVIGIPLYICASASTPVAAALVLKGLSPGAALVFLLAGPATNAATMTVVARQLGKAAVTVYVLAIAVSSLVIGWGVNRFYSWLSIDITGWMDQIGDSADSGVYLLSSIVLVALLVRNYLPRRKAERSDCGCHQ